MASLSYICSNIAEYVLFFTIINIHFDMGDIFMGGHSGFLNGGDMPPIGEDKCQMGGICFLLNRTKPSFKKFGFGLNNTEIRG